MYTSRDRKCHFQGHVTLTYKVNRQGHDIRLYSIDFPEVKKYRKKNHCCSMYTSRDRKCHFQGHVTLTYRVTRQGHDIGWYSVDFPELKNLRSKNNYCSSVYTSEDKNAVKSVMTSWRQVTTSWRRVMTIQPSVASWTRKWILYISWKFQLDILIGTRTTAFLTLGVSKDPTALVKELFSPHLLRVKESPGKSKIVKESKSETNLYIIMLYYIELWTLSDCTHILWVEAGSSDLWTIYESPSPTTLAYTSHMHGIWGDIWNLYRMAISNSAFFAPGPSSGCHMAIHILVLGGIHMYRI